jgi:hypothetical protein
LSPAEAANVLDVNQDTVVNNFDLQWLLDHLKGGTGNVATVPEPSTLLLGLIGGVGLALSGILAPCRCRL